LNPTHLTKDQDLFSFVIGIDDSTRPSPSEFKRRMEYILKYWRDFSPIIITVVMHPVNTGGYYEKRYKNFAKPLKDLIMLSLKYEFRFYTCREIIEYFEYVKHISLTLTNSKILFSVPLKRATYFEFYSSNIVNKDKINCQMVILSPGKKIYSLKDYI